MKTIDAIRAYAVFFALLGATALVVGVHDFSIANASFGLTFGSIVLVAAGITVLVAALHLADLGRPRHWKDGKSPTCKQRVLVACLVTIVLGVYVFLSTIGTRSAQRVVVIVVSVVLVAVALAAVAFFRGDVGLKLPHVQTTIVLTLLATGIGVSEFWYERQYTPSHIGRAVALTADLKLVGTKAGYDVVQATVGYEDIGGRNVAVIGSTYTLTGSRVVSCRVKPTAPKLDQFFASHAPDPQRSRFMADVREVQPATVLAAGKLVADGKRLDANVPATRQFVFDIPHGSYQLIRLRAQLFAISDNVLLSQVAPPAYTHATGDYDLYGVWRIDDFSWLHTLVYGRRRWIAIRYELAFDPSKPNVTPDLRVTARFLRPTWSESAPSAEKLKEEASDPRPSDASEPFADAELSLAPVADPTDAQRATFGCES